MSSQPGVVLLVEDNSDDAYLTVRAFRQNDITNEIVVARDGVEALALLLPEDDSEPLRPIIVLLDINMPRMGGLEVLRRLHEDPRTRSLPVIMLTTSGEDQDIIDSYEFGANSFVSKPVTTKEFLAASKALGVYWLGFNKQVVAGQHPT
jgi:two-component system response regulator